MNLLDYREEELKKLDAIHTISEIAQQPDTWRKTIAQIRSMREEIRAFIARTTDHPDYDIIFTGAGTSEFVGNVLFSYVGRLTGYHAKSYASTDITATPENYISADKPTLLVSFGRSGDSPESVGAVQSAESVNRDHLCHLFITCNKNGALSRRAAAESHCLAINLAEETDDQSFAMTSSFSNMYLAALLCFSLDRLEETASQVEELISAAAKLLRDGYPEFRQLIANYNFRRIVYLGSNTLKGIAQESALKMLELNTGEIITMYDTPMGFRHGPKSIINDDTLTVVYLSDLAYTRQYEVDLLKEMAGERRGNKILAVCNTPCGPAKELADFYYCYNTAAKDNVLLGLEYVVAAQLIAVFKSLKGGHTPDHPNPAGIVHRVVTGVTLYPYKG